MTLLCCGQVHLVPVMCEGQLNAESLEWMKPPDNVPVSNSFERLKLNKAVQTELGFTMNP